MAIWPVKLLMTASQDTCVTTMIIGPDQCQQAMTSCA